MKKEIECYELMPTNGRKSFYGKAIVRRYNDGSRVLYSYNTPIMEINADGGMRRLYDDEPSMTTSTHIKSFSGLDKKGFMRLNV